MRRGKYELGVVANTKEALDEEDSIEIFSKLNSGIVVKEYKEHIEDFM